MTLLEALKRVMDTAYPGWDTEYEDQESFEESVWQSDRAHEAALPAICEIRAAILSATETAQ